MIMKYPSVTHNYNNKSTRQGWVKYQILQIIRIQIYISILLFNTKKIIYRVGLESFKRLGFEGSNFCIICKWEWGDSVDNIPEIWSYLETFHGEKWEAWLLNISLGLITTRSQPDSSLTRELELQVQRSKRPSRSFFNSLELKQPGHVTSFSLSNFLDSTEYFVVLSVVCTLLRSLSSAQHRTEQSLFDVCLLFCCLHIQKYQEERILFLTSLCYRI